MIPIPPGLRLRLRIALIGGLALMLVPGPASPAAGSRDDAPRTLDRNTAFQAERLAPDGQDLTTRMRGLLEGQTNNAAAEVGFLLKEVQGDVLASWQQDFQTYPASSIKVLHHLHTMRTVENSGGAIDITMDTIPTCQSCPSCASCTACPATPPICMAGLNCSDDTNTSAQCSGNAPVNLSIQCVLQLMMMPSDNQATNATQTTPGTAA